MMKRVAILTVALLLACLVGVIVACGGGSNDGKTSDTQASGKTQVLRLATLWPVGDPVTNNIQEFVDKFNAQAGGKYTIELHPSGALVAIQDSFEALRSGSVEMAGWPIAVFGSVVPEFNMAELPFAVNSIEADAEYNTLLTPIFDKVLTEKYNMKTVFNFTCQGLDITSIKPIKTLEDWQGFLCQTISPVTGQVVKALGGSGVPVDFSESYQAIQKNVVQGTLNSGSAIVTFKVYEVAKNITRAYLTPAGIGVWINLDVYKKMPKDIQQLLDKLGMEAQASTNANMIKIYHENYEKMTSLGMNVIPLPGSERVRWVEKLKPYDEELLGKLDKDTADKIRTITKDLDKKYPYMD
jgi:TRAP-type C4-dicarboxylate transport system substrate-binding protein